MKRMKSSKKLALAKITVSNLEKVGMSKVNGGVLSETPTECGLTVCRTACYSNCVACMDTVKDPACW